MEKRFVIGIDEGTTSERVVLFDRKKGRIVDSDSAEIKITYPNDGWVEQDGRQIIFSVQTSLHNLITKNKLKDSDILGIAITNQRETVVAWDKAGQPVSPVIVWQCRRTAEYCGSIPEKDKRNIRKKTGLIMDAYFSASKMKWMLEKEKRVKECAAAGELHLGTIDSFLVYALTQGESFVTDTSNASRTMLVDLKSLQSGVYEYDAELLKYFGIKRKFLPKIVNSAENVGTCKLFGMNIPILSIVGDQQGSMFGQGCFNKGQAKNTYGTGCFFLQNVGSEIDGSLRAEKLLTTVAWSINGKTDYALEGSVFHAGSQTHWLMDELKLIDNVQEIEPLCKSLISNDGVYLLPAFTGIGAPYWNGFLRGRFVGLTLATKKAHLVRACMESICYMVSDILNYASSLGFCNDKMVCDGGVSKNDFVMQFQSDILNKKIYKSAQSESTVIGAIYLALIAGGAVNNMSELKAMILSPKEYMPKMNKKQREKNLSGWQNLIKEEVLTKLPREKSAK